MPNPTTAPHAAPRRLVVSLNLPPVECSPNPKRAISWRRKSTAVKKYRGEVAFDAGIAKIASLWPVQPPARVRVSLDYYTARPKPGTAAAFFAAGRYRPLDSDNAIAAAKSALDGLRDACVIGADTSRRLQIGHVRIHSRKDEHQGRAALVLTIEEVTEDA